MGDDNCSGHKWGYIASGVVDPGKCIADCREQFLASLKIHSETLVEICHIISNTHRRHNERNPLWDVYCCDSQLCGVDNIASLGEDPNVNWFISTCANVEIDSLEDPGPPPSAYTCPQSLPRDEGIQCQDRTQTSSRTSQEAHTIEPLPTTFEPSMSKLQMTDVPAIETIIPSTIIDPQLTASLSHGEAEHDNSESDGSSMGPKMAIAVSASLGLFLLATFLIVFLCCMRARQRRRTSANSRSKTSQNTANLMAASSPSGRGYTSPLRQIWPLNLLMKRAHSTSDAEWRPSITDIRSSGSPRHPICSSMNATPLTRQDDPRGPFGGLATPLLPRKILTSNTRSAHSSVSGLTDSSSILSADWQERFENPPPSRRFVRHHGISQCPPSPGPAPNRSLPPSPTATREADSGTLNSARHGNIGVAIGIVDHNPANGITLAGNSRDLCEHTLRCQREERDSGGSWPGNGGGGPGVSNSRRADAGMARRQKLEETDLEDLGGGYRQKNS